MPFLNSEGAGRANLNVAGRATHYSTSGMVYSWKIGGTWDLPLDGFRIRAVESRDVRAPNLSELFAAPVSVTNNNFTNPFTNSAVNIIQNTIGNAALKPEIAYNTEVGLVLSRPHWLPGFSASIDYYRIKINGVISSLSAQQEVNLCQQGVTSLCNTFSLPAPPAIGYVNSQSFNLASIKTDGFDIEASYRQTLDNATFTLRGLATNVRHFITDPGIPGTIPVDTAGVNANNTPKWKVLLIESVDTDKINFFLQQRWFSAGTYANTYVVCAPGTCPVSTANNPTIDSNRMPGALYFDIGASYKIAPKLSIYFKIDNLGDKAPAASPQTNTGVDVNAALYDLLGRFYHGGIRYNF